MNERDKGPISEQSGEAHELTLLNRKRLNMSGIKEVISFNENQIQIETVQGSCLIKGTNLNIHQLSLENGRLVVTGEIITIDYAFKQNKGKNLINRIFK